MESATSVTVRIGVEREGFVVRRAVLAQPHADHAGQGPDRFAERLEGRFVQHRNRDDGEIGEGGGQTVDCPGRCLVGLRCGEECRLVDPRCRDLGSYRLEFRNIALRANAVHDRVGAAEHTEQRPATTTVVRCALDEPGISTSWTRTPPILVSAGTGRSVVNA